MNALDAFYAILEATKFAAIAASLLAVALLCVACIHTSALLGNVAAS